MIAKWTVGIPDIITTLIRAKRANLFPCPFSPIYQQKSYEFTYVYIVTAGGAGPVSKFSHDVGPHYKDKTDVKPSNLRNENHSMIGRYIYIETVPWLAWPSQYQWRTLNIPLTNYCPACRTYLITTRFWVVVICPIIKCLTVLEFSFILFALCLFITIFNFILNYVPIVTFWIFTYHKIWILLIIFCFIWNYWIIYFLTCLEVFWGVVS